MGTICGFACLFLRTPLPRAQENRKTFLQPEDRRAQGERPRKRHGFLHYIVRMKLFCPDRWLSSKWAARQEEVFMLHCIIKDNLPCSTLRVLHGAQQWASKNCSFSTQIKSWPWNLFSVFYLIVISKIKIKAIMTCFAVGDIPYNDLKI